MASTRITRLVAVVAVLCALAAAASSDYVSMFEDFKKAYGKAYATPAEDALRLRSFIANMKKAETAQLTNPYARFGVNGLSDLTEEEWSMRRGDAKYFQNVVKNRAGIDVFRFPQREVDALKTTQSAARIDWRTRGAVTPIKNQERCGGCWAFSTTGNIEGQWFLAGHTLTSLSEQQLLSCDTTCNGCHGGLMDSAFAWLIQNRNGVIDTEASYPFVSGQGNVPQCTSGHTGGAQISGYRDIAHNEDQMAAYTYQNGPISIGVDSHTFQTYQGGIVTDCVSVQMDHAVLIVGYDDTHNPPYWIVKNQWGTSWGEDGYIRLEKGTNQCLITGAPSSSYIGNSGSSSGSAGSASTAGSGSGAAPSGSGSGAAPSGSGSGASGSGSSGSGSGSGSFPF